MDDRNREMDLIIRQLGTAQVFFTADPNDPGGGSFSLATSLSIATARFAEAVRQHGNDDECRESAEALLREVRPATLE